MSDPTQSTHLAQWKAALRPRELQLSIGPVLIRPVQLDSLVANGSIPLPLLQKIDRIQPRQDGTFGYEDLLVLAPAVNAVALACVVDPPLTEHGDDNSIAVHDIPMADRLIIFEEASKTTTSYAPFPGAGEPDSGDAAVSDGGEVRDATE